MEHGLRIVDNGSAVPPTDTYLTLDSQQSKLCVSDWLLLLLRVAAFYSWYDARSQRPTTVCFAFACSHDSVSSSPRIITSPLATPALATAVGTVLRSHFQFSLRIGPPRLVPVHQHAPSHPDVVFTLEHAKH